MPLPTRRSVVGPDEVDELRILATWIADHEPPALALDPVPDAQRLQDFAAGGRRSTCAAPPP